MAEQKSYTGLAILCVALVLIAGVLGYIIHPETVVDNTKINELTAQKSALNAQVTDLTRQVTTLNVKVTELQATQSTNEPATVDYLANAKAEFLNEVADNNDLQWCEDTRYDVDQISISNTNTIANDYAVAFGKDGTKTTQTVTFEPRLKYLDKDVESKCYVNLEVSVTFEQGEDPEVEYNTI
jgi:outer membrane murein-binding lipoprotein Lpp